MAVAFGRGIRENQWWNFLSLGAVDHEGEVLESLFAKRRDRKTALKFLRKAMKQHGSP